jgi:hypothetical protein
MPVIKNGQWEAPFWGASTSFITGQDMLGMQNTSISTYATLLPGLTNLTRRIRYYGFYVWLLEQYAKTKAKVSVTEYYKFIRRGELLLAFVMAYNYTEELGVVGSLYARNYLQKNIDPIDIAAGADYENENKYWQYQSGAFGQYYQGMMSSIGLIAPSENENRIFVSTPEYGRKLAKLFEGTIDDTTRQKYLEAIERGYVSKDELSDFGKEFSLSAIEPSSKEWSFYINMLFTQDYPNIDITVGHSTFRLETILLYMEYIKEQTKFESAGSFPRTFHFRLWDKSPFKEYETCTGWHYYSLNEFTHYALETIFWAFLVELGSHVSIFFSDMISKFVEDSYSTLNKYLELANDISNYSFDIFSNQLYQKRFDPLFHITQINNIKKEKSFLAVTHALILLGLIYTHDKDQITTLNTYARKHGMYRDGEVTDLFSWIQKNEQQNLHNFLHKLLLQHIINRHIEVAMRKMRNRNENTLKFILEDNYIKPLDSVEPVWTTPRIDSLHQFLLDLKIIQNNSLSDIGNQLLLEKTQRI